MANYEEVISKIDPSAISSLSLSASISFSLNVFVINPLTLSYTKKFLPLPTETILFSILLGPSSKQETFSPFTLAKSEISKLSQILKSPKNNSLKLIGPAKPPKVFLRLQYLT